MPALDGLRGVAVAAVFALHYHPDVHLGPAVLRAADRAAELGWAGVSLFFALSGFLITGILWDRLDRPQWWREFYIRRSLRIFPLYYLVLLATALIAFALGATLKGTAKIGFDFLYLSDVPWLWGEMFGFPLQAYLAHFWSLAVEEQFYLIWPFLLVAFRNSRRGAMKLCVAVWLTSFAFRLVAVSYGWSWLWPHHFLLSRAGELCAGSLLALALRHTSLNVPAFLRVVRWTFCLSLAGVAVMLVVVPGLSLMDSRWSTLGVAVLSVLFTSLIALCIDPRTIGKLFLNPVLRWIGRISYGIYVYHLLLYGVFRRVATWMAPHAAPLESSLLLVAVGICGTLCVASSSFYIIELPLLSLKDRLTVNSAAVKRGAEVFI